MGSARRRASKLVGPLTIFRPLAGRSPHASALVRRTAFRRLLVSLGLVLLAFSAGCGSRTSLGGFHSSSGGAGGSGGLMATGGTLPSGGTASAGGFASGGLASGGSPAGGTQSGGSGGIPLPLTLPDYFKSDRPGDTGVFGAHVALSADGLTLAVATPGDRSTATGINGDPFADGATSSGAVYVYVRSGDSWARQAYIKASNTAEWDYFGTALALSGDGNRLVVGAVGEASSATGIEGDQTDNAAQGSGALYVFGRYAGVWGQEAYVKAPNAEAGDQFGKGLAISGDGSTIAVGAIGESSAATGVTGDMTNNGAYYSGAVYVLVYEGVGFAFQAYVKASNTDANDEFGTSIALSGDGNTLVVGAPNEDSAATGPSGQEDDDSSFNAGAAYVFSRTGTSWSQVSYLKASNTDPEDKFGFSVACSSDGNTIALGARSEQSLYVGNELHNSGVDVGAVYVHERSGLDWKQTAYIKATNPHSALFGSSVALSADGRQLLVGATGESSSSAGLNGDQNDRSSPFAGAAYLFRHQGAEWSLRTYIKAHYPASGASFGYSVSLDGVAKSVAIGAPTESGSSPGINGDPTDLTTSQSGAAYVYPLE